MQAGSTIRVTIGERSITGTVMRVINIGTIGTEAFDGHPNDYWDLEYEIDGTSTGMGFPKIGRWKQNVDGGHVAYVVD